jgi:hypothetical protein
MRKPIAAISLALAVTAGAFPAASAATPASPGACHMINASPQGVSGMHNSAEPGFVNMMDLVLTSLGAGCVP